MFGFIKQMYLDGIKPSFGRFSATPFLVGALGLGIADGVHSLLAGKSALDAAVTLAGIGISMYTGSKALSIPTTKAQILAAVNSAAPETDSKAG